MTTQARSNLRGASLALIAFGLFSTHDVVVKILGADFAAFQIVFFSVLLSFPLVMFMLIRDTTPGTLIPVHPWWTTFRTAAVVLTASSAFYAFSVLPLAQVYSILFATPLFITLLSIPILGEKVGLHRWAAVSIGLTGVMIVLQPGSAQLGLGHLAAGIAATGSAFASVVVRKIGKDERSAVLLLYPMMANFVAMAAILPLVYRPMPIESLGLVGILSMLAFAAGLLLILAYKSADATVVAPMQYSQILWAAAYGAVFFNEFPNSTTWPSSAILICSGLYIVLRESLSGISVNRPVLKTKSRNETGTAPRVSVIERLTDRET